MLRTTDLCDQYSEELQIAEPLFTYFGGKSLFSGPIATVKVKEDNVLVVEALETVPEGSILVVDGEGSMACALLGDRLAGIAVTRGLSGIIVHGCVRDTADLATMNVGILALAPMPKKSRKEGKGERDVPVTFAGVTWTPGHWAYIDEDGIVVSERPLQL
ncbi:regulator of ribonuclease activity A [Marininema mesophilum]|uniref:4-hydroxy-4-methyl-2-oxoglutarate aldolase n=1 Tax=Marininema mesophilum TaxID=1048340 RepID=A0A1H3B9E3_9BACL|nr:ribonuclease E activity regulator RraA [Marininema mesophilum]SDX38415.1 regulator of ribonuclease activity A [Marininema mesophilum]